MTSSTQCIWKAEVLRRGPSTLSHSDRRRGIDREGAIEEVQFDEARRFLGDHPDRAGLRCARLKVGRRIASGDALESWVKGFGRL